MDAFDIAQIMANQDPKRPLKLRYGTVSSVGKGGELEVMPDGISGTPIPAVKCCSPSVNDRVVLLTTETEWLAVAVIGGHQGAIDARGSSKIDSLTLKSPLSLASGGTGATASAAARANLSVPGATHANGYWGITRPDGNGNDYLRAPSDGFIPYQSGGNGYLGTSGWPWAAVYAKSMYVNGTKVLSRDRMKQIWSGTLSRGGTVSIPAIADYVAIGCHLDNEGTMVVGFRNNLAYSLFRCVGAIDTGTATYLYVASFLLSGTNVKLVAACQQKQLSNGNGGAAKSVTHIFGLF